MLTNLLDGLGALGNGPALAYLFGGSLAGVFLGVVPGLGGVVLLSMVLAFIYHINLTGAICLFLASYAATFFSASISSILLNTPAHPEAFAVTLDGFPMAQRGEAGRALGISASSTMIGGIVGCVVLVCFIPLINELPNLFHPPEYVAMIFLALVLVSTLGTNSASKALISLGCGVMVSTIGADPVAVDGESINRFIFGAVGLQGGVSLVALALGLFAIPQMVMIFGTGTTVSRQDMTGQEVEASSAVQLGHGFSRQVVDGILETRRHWLLSVRSAIVGVLIGLIPGVGGFAANFISYGIAQQTSHRRKMFGTGIPEGIIAPESSSLAKEAGGLIPLMGLGIPGGVAGAIFLAALSIEGVKTGYGVAQAYPSLLYEMAWVILFGGLIGTVAGVLAAPALARVTRVPGPLIVPIVFCLAVIGPFASAGLFFAVVEVMVFGFLGLVLRRLRYAVATFAVGLVLGPTLEQNLYLTHQVFPGVSFLIERPFADCLFALCLVILVGKSVQMRRDTRHATDLALAAAAVTSATGAARYANTAGLLTRGGLSRQEPYPILAMLTTLALATFSIAFAVYGGTHYLLGQALLPCIGSGIVGAASLWRVPIDVSQYVSYRHTRKAQAKEPTLVLATAETVSSAAGESREGAPAEALGEVSVAPRNSALHWGGSQQRALPAIRERQWGLHGQFTRELMALGWFGALIVASYVFGFEVSIPLFIVAYALSSTRRSLHGRLQQVVFGAVTAAVMWGITFEIQGILHVAVTPLIRL